MIEITIPINIHTIVSELNKSGEHWTKKMRRHKMQHALVGSYLSKFKRASLPCEVTLTRVAPRKFDFVNLVAAFKWIQDCIADWLIPNLKPGFADADDRITWNFRQIKSTNGCCELKIEIKEMEK